MKSNAKAVALTMTRKAAYTVPIFGWLLKDAVNGGPNALLWFIFNMVGSWLVAIYYLGYPAIIIPALIAVPVMFAVLIWITMDK